MRALDDEVPEAPIALPVLRLPFDVALMAVLVVLFVFFTWVAVTSAGLPPPIMTTEVGPGRFPMFSGVGGMVCCAFAFAYALRRWMQRGAAGTSRAAEVLEIKRPLSILSAALLIVLWVEGMIVVGFYVTSLVVVPLILLLGGERRPWWIISFTAGFLIFVYLCFALLLAIEFP